MLARLAQQRTPFNAPVPAEWSQQNGRSRIVAADHLQLGSVAHLARGSRISGLRRAGAVC